MAYFLSLFSPETHFVFTTKYPDVACFKPRQERNARRLRPGDKILCYLTKLSRWCGLFEVTGPFFFDDASVYAKHDDGGALYTLRVPIRVVAWLEPEYAIPIKTEDIWSTLSFTRQHTTNTASWTSQVRSNLTSFSLEDGQFLEERLLKQVKTPHCYPFSKQDLRKLATLSTSQGDLNTVTTEVSESTQKQFFVSRQQKKLQVERAAVEPVDVRESIQMQAMLARIGIQMGMKIWIPANDRKAVVRVDSSLESGIVSALPLHYSEVTLKTIENIDVLWLKGRSIVRAFEVEHTTAIYSGLLRMADLLALQPNMDIQLHIVAPLERREKVFREIRRPVFYLFERKPLIQMCTFLSYQSIQEISALKHLEYCLDGILDEYAEQADSR